MSRDLAAIDALFLALSARDPDTNRDRHGVFMRAGWHLDIKKFRLTCVQTFRPVVDDLARRGVASQAELPPSADLALYAATRDRQENRLNLARLWRLLPAGGALLAAQYNDLGAKSLEKDMKTLAGTVSVLCKFHSRAIVAVKPSQTDDTVLEQWLDLAQPAKVEGTNMVAVPGMFSAQRIDAGSALLARFLPADLAGYGADLGAGWGYLSHHVLSHAPRVAHIDMYEAEKLALDMARVNTQSFAGKTSFFWVDLQTERLKRRYDFILCNPPVHHLDVQDIDLGRRIVAAGLAALAPGGRMFVVANRHLPYEEIAVQAKTRLAMLAEAGGYKVLEMRA